MKTEVSFFLTMRMDWDFDYVCMLGARNERECVQHTDSFIPDKTLFFFFL